MIQDTLSSHDNILRGILRKEVQTKNSKMITLFRRRSHSYAVFLRWSARCSWNSFSSSSGSGAVHKPMVL